jgi:uncharacterized protein YjbI with pentapeptide repeats
MQPSATTRAFEDRSSKAVFDASSFRRPVDYESTTFNRAVSFVLTEFDSDADFAGAQLLSASRFTGSRFSRSPDFEGSQFGPQEPESGPYAACANGTYVWTTFCSARLKEGADFLGASFRGVSFAGMSADGDIDFSAAQFHGSPGCIAGGSRPAATGVADFSTTNVVGELSFTNAEFDCLANFDQARISDLELSGATLQRLWFPRQQTPSPAGELGRIGVLHLSVDDVSKVNVPPSAGSGTRRQELESVLQLVEDRAHAAGDIRTANEARVRRLSLIRASRPFVPRILDWAVWWGLLGYLVRPSHQAIAIAIVLLMGLTGRLVVVERADVSAHRAGVQSVIGWTKGANSGRRQLGRELRTQLKRLSSAIGEMFAVLFRLRPPEGGGWPLFEYVLLKFLLVVLAINIGNVWPAFRSLVEGVF